jgi:hypothetical protein
MKLRTVAAALVVVALLGAGGTLTVQALLSGGGEPLPPVEKLSESWLQGVNINELAGQGLYLSPPPQDYVPKTSSGFAKHTTDSQYSNVSARQILLAHLQTQYTGGFEGQVYIINFDPADLDLHAFCPSSTPIYALSFVDADTGKLLSTIGEDSPSPNCGPGLSLQTPAPTPAGQ